MSASRQEKKKCTHTAKKNIFNVVSRFFCFYVESITNPRNKQCYLYWSETIHMIAFAWLHSTPFGYVLETK
jgi:hypothetical protein